MLIQRFGLVALFLVASPVVAQDPDAEIRFGAGIRMLRDGFPERALAEIQVALKKDPENAFYLKGLSVAYSQLADKCKATDSGCRNGHLKKAVETAQKALAFQGAPADFAQYLVSTLEGAMLVARSFDDLSRFDEAFAKRP